MLAGSGIARCEGWLHHHSGLSLRLSRLHMPHDITLYCFLLYTVENMVKCRIQVRNEKGTVYLYNLLNDQPTLAVCLCTGQHT